VKTIIKEYGKKLLSLVMAVVMTLTLVNLAPFAQEAQAATSKVIFTLLMMLWAVELLRQMFMVQEVLPVGQKEQIIPCTEMQMAVIGILQAGIHLWMQVTICMFSMSGMVG
jgi:hypothetical protein